MQEVTKSQNHVLRADPTWSINSGKMESRLVDFPEGGSKPLRRKRVRESGVWWSL